MEFSPLSPGGRILSEILVVKTLEHKDEYNVITTSWLIFNIFKIFDCIFLLTLKCQLLGLPCVLHYCQEQYVTIHNLKLLVYYVY